MYQRIIVDADSCPVKNEIIKLGQEYSVLVIFVASFAHYMGELNNAEIIYVDSSNQSTDLFIANLIKQKDIIITDDYGLASMVLKKGVKVLSFRGIEYTDENINGYLAQRHFSAKMRRSGQKTKGPKAFTDTYRKNFVENLRKILKF